MTKKAIYCKNCKNIFGTQQNNVVYLNYKRVNNIEFDFEIKKLNFKCRTCSQYSTLTYDGKLTNEIDLKKTARKLL